MFHGELLNYKRVNLDQPIWEVHFTGNKSVDLREYFWSTVYVPFYFHFWPWNTFVGNHGFLKGYPILGFKVISECFSS
jgi:hypothetical protein